jgi:large subunit ribosomal protein L24
MKKYKRMHLEKQKLQNKWIREGDEVLVLAGNDKGKSGKVLSRTKTHITIEGLNTRKKTMRKSEDAPKGRILDIEMPMHASNVCLCDKEGNPMRLSVKQDANGKKELCYGSNEKQSVHRTLTK